MSSLSSEVYEAEFADSFNQLGQLIRSRERMDQNFVDDSYIKISP